jgi:hypothetical protein
MAPLERLREMDPLKFNSDFRKFNSNFSFMIEIQKKKTCIFPKIPTFLEKLLMVIPVPFQARAAYGAVCFGSHIVVGGGYSPMDNPSRSCL